MLVDEEEKRCIAGKVRFQAQGQATADVIFVFGGPSSLGSYANRHRPPASSRAWPRSEHVWHAMRFFTLSIVWYELATQDCIRGSGRPHNYFVPFVSASLTYASGFQLSSSLL